MANHIVWADIPVTDLDRACRFYGAVLQKEVKPVEGMDGVALVSDPAVGEGEMVVSFDLARGENSRPSLEGCTIYLDSGGDPEGMLRRVQEAGGEVLMPVTDMGEMVGSIGFFKDSEGNRIGVHKPPKGRGG